MNDVPEPAEQAPEKPKPKYNLKQIFLGIGLSVLLNGVYLLWLMYGYDNITQALPWVINIALIAIPLAMRRPQITLGVLISYIPALCYMLLLVAACFIYTTST